MRLATQSHNIFSLKQKLKGGKCESKGIMQPIQMWENTYS